MKDTRYEGWIAVFKTGRDYEAEVVRDRLDDAGLSAVIMSKRDSAFNLNVGSLSDIFVMVPPRDAAEARAILADQAFSAKELEDQALAASPDLNDDDEELGTVGASDSDDSP